MPSLLAELSTSPSLAVRYAGVASATVGNQHTDSPKNNEGGNVTFHREKSNAAAIAFGLNNHRCDISDFKRKSCVVRYAETSNDER
jgi:hypothetical protein